MNPKLSIIIPCYNTETTLEETLESVINQYFNAWEAIIVNDGSTDNTESIALKWVNADDRFAYFKKENGGLGSARNFGITKAQGEYILPLDSDNKIMPEFPAKAINIFENDGTIGVVHGHACYFGEKIGLWHVDKFDYEKILIGNYIDACAIYKKSLWEKVGGYDINIPYQGNEDWSFWIDLGKLKTKFFHLNEITFEYRVSKLSMINSYTQEMFDKNRSYIKNKYSKEYYSYFKKNKEILDYYSQHPFKTGLIYFKKWLNSFYEFN